MQNGNTSSTLTLHCKSMHTAHLSSSFHDLLRGLLCLAVWMYKNFSPMCSWKCLKQTILCSYEACHGFLCNTRRATADETRFHATHHSTSR